MTRAEVAARLRKRQQDYLDKSNDQGKALATLTNGTGDHKNESTNQK